MNKFFCAVLLLISMNAKSQVRELNVVDLLKNKNDSSISVFYLTAHWCHPCMEKLPEVQKLKMKYPQVKFYFIFDNFYDTKKYVAKIYEIIDPSDFYVFPKKYYPPQKTRLINVKTGSSWNMVSKFRDDIEENKLFKFNRDDIWFGHAIIKAHGKIYLTINVEQQKFIEELENYLTQ